MLFTNASYMPGRLSGPTGMNKMGLEQDNLLILMKKCDFSRIVFFGKKSGFGNHTRVEGKYDGETGAGASLFWRFRRKSECPITPRPGEFRLREYGYARKPSE